MATITGLTAERMLEIEAASVVDGDVVGNDLFLTRKDGSLINAGNVRGPAGPDGPMASPLAVVSAAQLLDVGQVGQIRAGRQLSPADFTNMGLQAPLGLWNLGNTSDASGNGRNLNNKGSVPFGTGINGLAATAAVFAGSSGQALYIPEGSYPGIFQIKFGSFGCWFRGARAGVEQAIMSKFGGGGTSSFASRGWAMEISGSNVLTVILSFDGATNSIVLTATDFIPDDKWHFAVVTFDGTWANLYVDGALEGRVLTSGGVIFPSTGPLNIGNYAADATLNGITGTASYSRVDEAFVTGDVLTDDQVRNLYCASIPHSLGAIPSSAVLSPKRKRRGGPLPVAQFPAQPLRLYNFFGGGLTDGGSANLPVAPASTVPTPAPGPDGIRNNALYFPAAHGGVVSSDAGLPSGLSPRAFGCWFKMAGNPTAPLISWGSGASSASGVWFGFSAGNFGSQSVSDTFAVGPWAGDGLWHFGVGVEDNAAPDGVKRKYYLDGRLVCTSLGMGSIVLGGANRFRIGAGADGNNPLNAEIMGAFVIAGTLTLEQIRKLYDYGSTMLAPSPKLAADHIEAFEAARLLAIFDTLETCDVIDLGVLA